MLMISHGTLRCLAEEPDTNEVLPVCGYLYPFPSVGISKRKSKDATSFPPSTLKLSGTVSSSMNSDFPELDATLS